MSSDAVKLAKLQNRSNERAALIEVVKNVVDNPVIELVAWTMFCNNWAKEQHKTDTGLDIFGTDLAVDTAYMAGLGVIALSNANSGNSLTDLAASLAGKIKF